MPEKLDCNGINYRSSPISLPVREASSFKHTVVDCPGCGSGNRQTVRVRFRVPSDRCTCIVMVKNIGIVDGSSDVNGDGWRHSGKKRGFSSTAILGHSDH